ncbi:MAG: hypothetical protein KDC61_02225 [Saprospiraceae bacterium]|nr:hypothetical protein [Saprospiraceae bacterium]
MQAKQLKGFLLLFDQLLANHLAQLANLNQLFSFCPQSHSQFFQVLHREVQYNMEELFISDEQVLLWKNEVFTLKNRQEEKSAELEFLTDNIAELKERVDKLAEALQENPSDKRLKRKHQTAFEALKAEADECKKLEHELQEIAQNIGDLNQKIGQTEQALNPVTDRVAEVLKQLLDAPKMFVRRRSRTLNHLLARFGVDLSEYDRLMRMLTADPTPELERRLIADKMRILKDYVRTSNGRNKGFNYWVEQAGKGKNPDKKTQKRAWGGKNISGFERRVSRLLGFEDATREYLTPSWVEVETLDNTHKRKPESVVHFYTDDADQGLLFNSKRIEGKECCVDDFIRLLIELGSDLANYRLDCEERNDKNRHFFGLYDNEDNLYGTSRMFNTKADALDARTKLSEQFQYLYNVEGMHLVEHILLRPKLDEVLQYADKNPYDNIEPPAEPVQLLCINLDECDHCGDCCFEIKMVDLQEDGDSIKSSVFNPFIPGNEGFEIKNADGSGLLENTTGIKTAFKLAIQHLRNYSISDDKKILTISEANGYPLATIELNNLPVKKPKVSEITSKFKEALSNNQIAFSFTSPFDSNQRLELKDDSDLTINVPAYKLDALFNGIYKIDGTNLDDDGNFLFIKSNDQTPVTLAQVNLNLGADQSLSGLGDAERDREKQNRANKVREAMLRCLSIRSFKIRITRLPREKCYNDEAWVLEISALKNAPDPNSDRIVFYRRVYQVENTWRKPQMTFLKYEQLSEYLARIRVVANEEENYQVLAHKGKFSIVLRDDKGYSLAQTDYVFDTSAEAELWAEEMRRAFALEQQKNCLCQSCNHNEDPYSFRATVVLPCWSKRFQSKAFRFYTEQVLRLETPAHIDLRIVWLGMEAMRRFENLYRNWLIGMVENNGTPELEVVNKLVHELCCLKDCTEDCSCEHSKDSEHARPVRAPYHHKQTPESPDDSEEATNDTDD